MKVTCLTKYVEFVHYNDLKGSFVVEVGSKTVVASNFQKGQNSVYTGYQSDDFNFDSPTGALSNSDGYWKPVRSEDEDEVFEKYEYSSDGNSELIQKLITFDGILIIRNTTVKITRDPKVYNQYFIRDSRSDEVLHAFQASGVTQPTPHTVFILSEWGDEVMIKFYKQSTL